ncbi:hypothetical protein [Brevundimonas sp.]|uniref:hypothetical protein n=1 Tax=Brevundimonas sp. TaxID=1871086 RepID=UPI0017FB0E72|nr:hypothetical protein [Brevundimonas sp.]MBA4808624.1 hypothetical protein [Brevundimonas sp.]
MRGIAKLTLISVVALAAATPAAAENWARFSASDRVVYLVDQDTLTPVDGVATARFARVPAQGDATDLSHETEELAIRCSDGQSRTTAMVTYGPDGAETDRIAEDGAWDDTPSGGIYGGIKSFACEDMRPQARSWPTIADFIAAGRGD